jgi:hypothetical protein
MENLRMDQLMAQDVGDRRDASRPNRRYLVDPSRVRAKVGGPLHVGGSRGRIERKLALPVQPAGNASVQHQARIQPPGPEIAIVGIGMAAEAILPWVLILISDIFLFDVPAWSLWVVFGGPLAFTLVALIVYRASRPQPLPAARAQTSAERQGQWEPMGGPALSAPPLPARCL